MDLLELINKYRDKRWGDVILGAGYCEIDDEDCGHDNGGWCRFLSQTMTDPELIDENEMERLRKYPTLVKDGGVRFYLPHHCDEWVIGSIEKAEMMVDNLNKAIKYAKENKYE